MGSVIKAGHVQAGTSTPGEAFPFDDMASSYLTKVREEANRLIAQARAEAQQIKTQAAEAGKREALQSVNATIQAKVEEQLRTLRPALDQAVSKLTQARLEWQRHWETHALKTAIAMAGRIVRTELSRQPQITLAWIREALELASGSEKVTLRLNPTDLKTLGNNVSDLIARLGQATRCEIVADAAVTAGGCIVETEFGTIDQQLESQLARLSEELLAH